MTWMINESTRHKPQCNLLVIHSEYCPDTLLSLVCGPNQLKVGYGMDCSIFVAQTEQSWVSKIFIANKVLGRLKLNEFRSLFVVFPKCSNSVPNVL